VDLTFGPQICGQLDAAAAREWLVTDGLGGFAMGTAAGLRTRRYHGLLVVATEPPIGRRLGLASLDPVLVVGDARLELATHEWSSGAVAPTGHRLLAAFTVLAGVPRWRWAVGGVVVEAEVAMVHGRPAVAAAYRLVRAPEPVELELAALCTWRDVHGERFAWGDPEVAVLGDGFVFEDRYRVRGPGFEPAGVWYRGVRYRQEAERGLPAVEDLFCAGRFRSRLEPGGTAEVVAWADHRDAGDPPPAPAIVAATRERARLCASRAGAQGPLDSALAAAADRFVVGGPTMVAGYPWFGDWSRDTMTSYEGILLETGRHDEGRQLLVRAAGTLSEGMLPNTADAGGTEFNTVDATLWYLHAVDRHVVRTGDDDLAAQLLPALRDVISHHLAGTRFNIGADPADGLLAQGADGWALTWMDARVGGVPVTPRAGKPVEVNALWVNGLAAVAGLAERAGQDAADLRSLEAMARASFVARFARPDGRGLLDVVDGPHGPDGALRPNQLLAVSLPYGPLARPDPVGRSVVAACAELVTPLGLRSLGPAEPAYLGHHRGGPADRDRAYHEGTVWPWLIGPYVTAATAAGIAVGGVLDGLEAHLGEWGLGSVSECADGDPPHGATGCPFQAWSVAELLRTRRLLDR
jgi:predicted glycogen debranching enzyme